jgi:hypothetical protein
MCCSLSPSMVGEALFSHLDVAQCEVPVSTIRAMMGRPAATKNPQSSSSVHSQPQAEASEAWQRAPL